MKADIKQKFNAKDEIESIKWNVKYHKEKLEYYEQKLEFYKSKK